MRRKHLPALLIAAVIIVALLLMRQSNSPVGNWGTASRYLNIRADHTYEAKVTALPPVTGTWRMVGDRLFLSDGYDGLHSEITVAWEKSSEGLILHADSDRPLIYAAR